MGETGDETDDSRHRQTMGSLTQRNQGGLPRGGDSRPGFIGGGG